MSQRFFVDEPIESDLATLSGNEAHHLSKVMRADLGDEVVLFDGSGCEFRASIKTIKRSEVVLEINSRDEVDREFPLPITLAVALPKGDRQRWLVEKAVELGVARLVPLVTTRGVAQPTDQARKRLERTVIEASKQCGRNRLMLITSPMDVADYFRSESKDVPSWVAHPGGESVASLTLPVSNSPLTRFAVGPEGGFTDEEIEISISAGWKIVDLGPRIMRIETAALALVAMWTQFA